MPEVKEQVRTFEINYTCDECGRGIMIPTGVSLLSDPPQYPHICTVCDAKMTFNKRYPLIITQT